MKSIYKIFFIIILSIGVFSIMPIENANLSINIIGSTSIQPVCEQLVEEYKKCNDMDINVQGGGSSLGIKCTENNIAEIGMSSKEVKSSNIKTYQLGKEGIAIVVNKNNPIDDLSIYQIQKIFAGEITNWNEISNYSGKINVIIREEGSGTLDTFKNVIMQNNQIKEDAIVQNSPGAIKQSIKQDLNGISFVSFTHLDNTLKDVSIDGVKISKETISNNSYKFQRPFLLLTSKTPNNQTKDFINWALSNNSSEILEEEKIIRGD